MKFFRKIRFRLFFNAKANNYLLYALGEIILVVAGILIALQVNNWNEYRKDRIKEKAILKELHINFKKNLAEFYPIKQSQLNTLKKGDIVFRNIHQLHIPVSRDSVYQSVTGMFGGYTYYPSNGVVESLISSGDFNLIQNDTLRKYLVSWKDVLTRYTKNVAIDQQLWSNIIEPYIIKNGDFLNLRNPKNIQLLQDPAFINMMVRKQFFQKNIVSAIQGKDGIEQYMIEIIRLSETQ